MRVSIVNDDQENRKFDRVLFQTEAILKGEDAEWKCEILDLSLHGALVVPIDDFQTDETTFNLNIVLSEDSIINMDVVIVHQKGNHFGLECTSIGMDSICHLRRLVELNIGDSALLERNLAALRHS